jgi:hypothetical protein
VPAAGALVLAGGAVLQPTANSASGNSATNE